MPAPEYRYLTTDLIGGQTKGDWLPLAVTSFGRIVNGSGTFTGALNLTAGTAAEQRNALIACEPRRSVLWCLVDGVPAWNGIIWDWPHQSVLDGTMPLSVSSLDSLFGFRYISDDLTFTNADVFDVFRGLAAYALTKDINCSVAGLNLGTALSGQTTTISYTGTDQQPIAAAWQNLVATYAFEYSFRPGFDASGNLVTFLDLGLPELGQQFPASGLVYNMPGNLLDYRWTRTGSSSANKIIATAPANDGTSTVYTSASPHGYDLVDLGNGYPLLEQPTSLTTVTTVTQAVINAYADGFLPGTSGTQLTPLLVLGNGQQPGIKQITLGSWCQLALTSPLHPVMSDGSPGYQGLARIIGWTLYPPGQQQPESAQIQAWIPTSAEQALGTGTGGHG